MNENIVAMVQRSPGIRTGQIADQLDVSFEEAQEQLQALVLANRLTGDLVPLSGGGKVMAYHVLGAPKIKAPIPFAAPPVPPESKFKPDGTKKPAASEEPKAKRPYVRHTPAAKVRDDETTDKPLPVIKAPDDDVNEAKPAQPQVVDRAEPGVFRACMWTDGVLELQVDGRMVLELDAGEQKLLKRALGFAV